VLGILIEEFVSRAEPISSRTVARHRDLGVSPATIRNTMADLEEMGMLYQPHTSAGRVPTDRGYRYYVDELMRTPNLPKLEAGWIEDEFSQGNYEIDVLVELASSVLGEVTSLLGISLFPERDLGVLKRIDLIPAASDKLLGVVTISSGIVKSVVMVIDFSPEIHGLEEVVSILNERLGGLSLQEIKRSLKDRLSGVVVGNSRIIQLILNESELLFSFQPQHSFYFYGTSNLLRQPEFRDAENVRALLGLIENRQSFCDELRRHAVERGVTVTIGQENRSEAMGSLSLVVGSYQADSLPGILGVIGPTRMPYSRLVPLVEFTARLLNSRLR
jgi:heat-inducible transcriptional repressor